MKRHKKARGFTLIEILVVIGIIAILAAIVIIAINPARQFAQGRNTQRESNINTYLNGIGQRMADNKGIWAATGGCEALPTSAEHILTSSSGTGTDLECLTPTYIPGGLPVDPEWTFGNDSLYTVVASSTSGRITVCAPNASESALGADNPGEICVTR